MDVDPFRREEEGQGIGPVDAGGAAVDQAAPVAEPTVQSTVQAEQPGGATDAVTGAPVVAPASPPTVRQPAQRGSPPPQGVIDQVLVHPQRVEEEARRTAADAQRHQAVIAAIKRQIQSQDAQELDDAYEAARMFGIDPATLAPQSRLLKQTLAEQEQMRANYFNDQKHGKLTLPEKAWNEVVRGRQETRSGNAIASIDHSRGFEDDTASIEAKIKRGEPLVGPERLRWENRHIAKEYIDKRNALALTNLADAQAELARRPVSPLLRDMDQAKTAGDLFKVFISNPFEIIALGLAQSAPDMVAGAAASALTGPAGGIVLNGALTYNSAFASAIVKEFKDRGIDLQDQAAVMKTINERHKMQEIYNKALTTAGIATMAEILTGGIGGIRLTGVRKRFVGEIVESGAQAGTQAVIGMGEKTVTSVVNESELPSSADVLRGAAEGAGGAMIDKAMSGIGSVARSGAASVGGKLQPHYQAFRDRNIPSRENVDYNKSNATFAKSADEAQRAADALAENIRREQGNRSIVGDPQARKKALEESAVHQGTLYLSWEAADRLRRAGKLDDDLMKELGISRQWIETRDAESPAKISRADLMTSRLKPQDIEEFSRDLRQAPDAMSARDADAYLSWRKTQLEKTSAQFEAPGAHPPDGFTTYRYMLAAERAKYPRDPDKARLKAAEATEYFINLAIKRGQGETADQLFLAEYPRLQPGR